MSLRKEIDEEFEQLQALILLKDAATLPYFTERFLRSNAIPKRKIRGRVYFAKEDLIEYLVNRSRVTSL